MIAGSRICKQCGALVPDGHHYCGRCGAFYNEDSSEARNETMFFGAMQAPGRARLILIRGEDYDGSSYHLNATKHIAGRNQGAILFPKDQYLSAKHSVFLYKNNNLFVRDEGSVNGTFLRVNDPYRLSDGDEIMVGEQVLQVEMLSLKKEYPTTKDDTLMYISPPKDYKFRLVQVIRGAKPGNAYCSVNNDLLIGREGGDVNFGQDRHVSKQHCRVTWEDGDLMLHDLGSKNGTYVRIKEEHQLHHGDYVFLGSELMRVEINV